jgi:tetratricopeptide (TPR) repeat protein
MLFLQFSEARTAAQECLEIQHARGDRSSEMAILLVLGNILIFSKEFEAGMELIQQAHVLSQSIDDIWRKANVLYSLGYYHREIPSYWEEAVVLLRQVGDWDFLINILSWQASHCILNGDVELAQKHIDEAEALREFNAMTNSGINIETTKSLIALARGDLDQAYTLMKQVMIRNHELGHRMGYIWARVRFGYIVLRLGNLSEARAILTETAREFLKDKFDIGVVFSLEGIAELCIATNKPAVAAKLIGWADVMRKRNNDTRPPIEQADVDKIITACLIKMGEVAFSDAYDESQQMTMDEAVAYAIEEVNQ